MAKGSRRQARVAALQALYEADNSGHSVADALQHILKTQQVPRDSALFAQELTERVLAKQDEIDRIIAGAAPAWPVSQLPAVDRNILRLAIAELLEDNGTPEKAAISEAVELAKQFGSDSSAKFVNGVLGTIARGLHRPETHHATVKRR